MNKATERAKVSVKGDFHLLWGLVISTIISAVGTIVIAKVLGAHVFGLYSVTLTAPTLIFNFRDWGVNAAIVEFSVQCESEKDLAKIRRVFLSGLAFEVILGTLPSLDRSNQTDREASRQTNMRACVCGV